jgi:mRNA-degrading endonuclease toxin of MazEF toxin-antitoxin module
MKRGDQYTDMTDSKLRPAVVAQGDFLNGLSDDTILVQITSTSRGINCMRSPLDEALQS